MGIWAEWTEEEFPHLVPEIVDVTAAQAAAGAVRASLFWYLFCGENEVTWSCIDWLQTGVRQCGVCKSEKHVSMPRGKHVVNASCKPCPSLRTDIRNGHSQGMASFQSGLLGGSPQRELESGGALSWHQCTRFSNWFARSHTENS